MMSCVKLALASLLLLVLLYPSYIHAWGIDGHLAICRIAQSRLSDKANETVKQLLPDYAEGDLGNVCSWADHVKFRYHWSSPLHYINVPDSLCNFQYNNTYNMQLYSTIFLNNYPRFGRDCKDEDGVKDRCVAGAVNNYTSQLLAYKKFNFAARSHQYNLTEALLFLSHLMGDIHQPLHVGHTSDKGGNTIDVHWYRRKTVLHHVWDDSIVETEEKDFYSTTVDDLIDAIQQNITSVWADQIASWERCSGNKPTCPDIYASESIKAACDWAYKGVHEDSTLEDDYFLSRLPTANLQLARAAVRLAATLNRVFS